MRSALSGLVLLAFVLPVPAAAQTHGRPQRAYSVVGVTSHSHSSPPPPQWVLAERIAAPDQFEVVQERRPHGCTVSGQPRVAIGARRAVARPLTFVTEGSVLRATVSSQVELGIGHDDTLEWWTAYEVPPAIRALPPSRETVALDADLSGWSVITATRTERAREGSFPPVCEGTTLPALATLTGRADDDGYAYCAGGALTVVVAWDRRAAAGRETLASYRTALLESGRTRSLAGRFVRLLERGRRRLVIVQTEAGLIAHQLR